MTYRPFTLKSFVPAADDGYSLGAPTSRWKDGYFGPSSLHFMTTSSETGTVRDWDVGVIETVGSTRGNLSIRENSTIQASFDVNGSLNFHRNSGGVIFSNSTSVHGISTYLNIVLASGGLLFNGGQASYTISGGLGSHAQSAKAWLRQLQNNPPDARLIGSASGTIAGTATRAGSSATDAQGADVVSLFEVCTDNTATTPITKFSFTGFQELAVDGYSTLPAYSYINDPDTGWYRSSTNTMAASSSANPKLFIGDSVSVATNFLPFIDDGYSLGSLSSRWHDGYFVDMFAQVPIAECGSGPYTVVEASSGTIHTNNGALAQVEFLLPTAASGLEYVFVVRDTDGIKITASGGDIIRIANSTSSSGGNATSSTIGDVLRIVALDDTEWIATSVIGTWVLA